MIKNWLSGLCFFVVCGVSAQVAPSEVIMTINNEPIEKTEFEYIFKKNNKDSVISKEDLDEYLDLFVKFKLKVKEAESLGLDKNPAFIKELSGYRTQLSKPYLTDSKLTDALLKEAYDRIENEVKASHILIKVSADATPEDTLKAYEKAMGIKRKMAASKTPFEEIAKKFSEDPSVKDNGGNLGYFSAFQMVYPFESKAFNTKVGEVSDPVRTSFGYHLVKVTNKRKALGKIKLSHIMISTQDKSKKEKQDAEAKINEISELIKMGDSFELLARTYSDDKTTANKDGAMNWVAGGKMIEDFENNAFALTEDGQVSAPFKTDFGWHIVRRDAYEPVESYESLLPDLKRKVAKDMRSQTTHGLYVQNKKKELRYKLYKSSLKKVASALDSTVFDSTFAFSSKVDATKKLYKLDGNIFNTNHYLTWLATNAKVIDSEKSWSVWNNKHYNTYLNETIFAYVDAHLEENHPEFKSLMNEYRDGILLFELTDSLVWSKAVKDSAGLVDYFNAHQSDFVWGERAKVDVYSCNSEDNAKTVIDLLKQNKKQNEISEIVNAGSKLALNIEEKKYEKGQLDAPKGVSWEKGVTGPFLEAGQYVVYHTTRMLESGNKELNEAKGMVTAAYQDYLEKQWIASLKEKYKVTVNTEVLYSIK